MSGGFPMRARLLPNLLAAALLAAAIGAPAADAAHRHGGRAVYRGKTSRGARIQASTAPGRITLIRFKVRMLCRDGSLLYGDASDFEATRLKRDGRFADTQYGKTDAVSWKGRVRGRKITGTLRVKDRLTNGVRCDSGPVRFAAKRVGGRHMTPGMR